MKPLTDIDKIKRFFPKHSKAMVKNFILIAQCVLAAKTVCLYKCATKVPGITGNHKVKMPSHYKRLLRFFELGKVGTFCQGVFMLVLSMIGLDSHLIVLDRTNWKIGKKNVNILALGILFNHCFIPLCWQQLNKRGNSNFLDRKIVMNRFLRWWRQAGKEMAHSIVVADREFIGWEWFEYLQQRELHFVFRLKENMYFELQKGCKKNAS
jgi:hypothetical protein